MYDFGVASSARATLARQEASGFVPALTCCVVTRPYRLRRGTGDQLPDTERASASRVLP